MLAVSAAGDDHWGELPTGRGYGVGTGLVGDACDAGDQDESFCKTRERNLTMLPQELNNLDAESLVHLAFIHRLPKASLVAVFSQGDEV